MEVDGLRHQIEQQKKQLEGQGNVIRQLNEYLMRVKDATGKRQKKIGLLNMWTKGTFQEGRSTIKSNPGNSPVLGKREQGVLKDPVVCAVGCPLNCTQEPESSDHVDCKDEKTNHVTFGVQNLTHVACTLWVLFSMFWRRIY